MRDRLRQIKVLLWLVVVGLLWAQLAGCGRAATPLQWYRGNTHTHTWWSDGDSPPEIVVKWYRDHGYQFLVLSDHNVLSEGEKWVVADKKRSPGARIYEETFGAGQVVKRRRSDAQTEYRCAPLDKVKAMFQAPGRFILVQGEEITDSFDKKPVHLNGVNLRTVVTPQHGDSILDTLQNNVNAVFAQHATTHQPMLVHVNHPNFGWALRAEQIALLQGPVFFEVGNGHPGVHNLGDETYMSTERMWDVALTKRLAEYHLPILYGVADDDAHSFTGNSLKGANAAGPGRGWIVVRAARLSPGALVEAMYQGDFYASTGVALRSVRFANDRLDIDIDARPGVSYKTQFIGTLEGYDGSVMYLPSDPDRGMTCRYSDDLGRVLAEQCGPHASYELSGREIYVRAKVTSTARHLSPLVAGEFQVAWVQPVQPAGRAAAVR
jgi:hypothetical protein